MKICKDCVHFADDWERGACVRPLTSDMEPIRGEAKRKLYADAPRERGSGFTLWGRIRCGPDAIFFEARTPTPSAFNEGAEG